MARKQSIYRIEDPENLDNRDLGKVFVVTEMPATRAQRWAIHAFLAMANNGVEIPDSVVKLGIVGLATYGLNFIGKLPAKEADELLTEMMTCVQAMPDPNNPQRLRGLVESDTEEVSTLFKLQAEVFKLHVDFTKGGGTSTSA